MVARRQAKTRIYELFAEIGKAMSSASRLELIDLLSQAPRTVEELAEQTHLSEANTSQHLQRLKAAGFVASEREGIYIRYHLADPAVARLWLELRSMGQRQFAAIEQAVDAYRTQRDGFETISIDELEQRLRRAEVLLIDVRPREEYEAGHLPHAISVPIDEFAERMEELPRDKTVVAYCRGPLCVYADEAIALLRDGGWLAVRFEEGVNEWTLSGRELEAER